MHPDKKLIFFDVDGTIIAEGKKLSDRIIPESFYTALKRLKENGHLCFINTGRSFAEMDEKILGLGFDGFVCGCGTYIKYTDQILLHQTLPVSIRHALIKEMETSGLEWVLEGSRFIYYKNTPCVTALDNLKQEHLKILPDAIKIIPADTQETPDFDKLCVCLKKEHHFEEFKSRFENQLTFIDRGRGFFEIVPNHFSKASGIQFLETYFQIPHENTISIGDSTNDLPMLEYTAYSICMGNGEKELFDVVDYVTDSIMEDGILHAMEHLALI